MADLFLSYDHEDVGRAAPIAAALEKAGHSVWWDRHIKGGSRYSAEIEKALSEAEVVVVLWSHQSVQSDWVRDEAARGRDSGRLVPVRIDDAEPPLGFGQHQTADLTRFRGRASSPQFRGLLDAIDGVSKGTLPIRAAAGRRTTPEGTRFIRAISIAMIAASVIASSFLIWNRPGGHSGIPIVAVAPASSSPAAAALAQDLLAKLGELQSRHVNSIRLVESADVEQADLLFKINGSLHGQPSASLNLVAGKDGSILWSETFGQPSGNAANLKQQIAYAAARVLSCASDGMSAGSEPLPLETLEVYLSGCAAYAELSGTSVREVQKVIPTLEQVTKKAPRFKAAWGKLLRAEAEVASNGPPAERVSIRSALSQHLIAAQQVDRLMPEVFQAEIALLPATHFAQRMEIVDKAIRLHPDDAGLLGLRSKLLMSVGRMGAAVEDAKHGASVDLLSPAAQSAYIFALAQSGRLDQALRELEKAQEIWPGAASLRETRFAIYVRYVDPAVALREMRTGPFRSDMPAAQEALLMTRLSPTPQNVDRAVAEALATKPQSTRQIIQVFAEFGREEELIQRMLTLNVSAQEPFTDVLFRPNTRTLRADPRFMLIAKRTGLLGYWKSSGQWPDFCFDPRLQYDCKAEAAKLAVG